MEQTKIYRVTVGMEAVLIEAENVMDAITQAITKLEKENYSYLEVRVKKVDYEPVDSDQMRFG